MNKSIVAAALLLAAPFTAALSTAHAATAVACEDMLKTLEDTLKTAKPSDADMKAVMDLKAKAEERCKAEDDRRADGFVEEAMKLLTKK
jgi:hypothetical protein